MSSDCGFKFSVGLTDKRDLVGEKVCFCVKYFPCFETATLISTCGAPHPAGNVTAWQRGSCECSFVVFGAWNTRVSPHCAQRKCRESSLLGWSDLLIHSALLDLRLTVQLLPIKVETQKKRGNTEKRRRKLLSYPHLVGSGGTSPPHGGRKWEALKVCCSDWLLPLVIRW